MKPLSQCIARFLFFVLLSAFVLIVAHGIYTLLVILVGHKVIMMLEAGRSLERDKVNFGLSGGTLALD